MNRKEHRRFAALNLEIETDDRAYGVSPKSFRIDRWQVHRLLRGPIGTFRNVDSPYCEKPPIGLARPSHVSQTACMRDDRSFEQRYVDAWRLLEPDAPTPKVTFKKWPRCSFYIIETPSGSATLRGGEFISLLTMVEKLANVMAEKRKPPFDIFSCYNSARPKTAE